MSAFDNLEPVLGRNPKSVSISNSEIQTFKGCRRRWMLGTYYGLQPNDLVMTGPLPLGTRIHNALEIFYRDGENPVDVYNRLLRVDADLFAKSNEATDEVKIKKFNSEAELGRRMIEGYLEWLDEENRDADIEYVSQEEKLDYRLNDFDPRVELIAKIDARVKRRSDGTRALMDHKTAAASNFNDYLKYAHHSEQLMHYVMLENLNTNEGDTPVDGGIYNVLKKVMRTAKATPPFYTRLDTRFNKKTLESFYFRTLGTVRDIMSVRDALDAGEDHRMVAYATQKMDWHCGTCPFFKGCFMLDDGSDAEGFFTDNYRQDNPNARYADDESESD